MSKPTDTYALGREQSKATAGPHAADARLRALGFRVVSRPAVGEAVWLWTRNGHTYTQREAERIVLREGVRESQKKGGL